MIATAILIAQTVGNTFDLSATAQLEGRSTQPPLITPSGKGEVIIAADVAASATGRLNLRYRQLSLALGVTPSITAADVEQGFDTQLMALGTGSAIAGWHGRLWGVTVSETAAYGKINSALMPLTLAQPTPGQSISPAQPTPTGQPLSSGQPSVLSAPSATTLDFGSSSTLVSTGGRVGSQTTLSVSGGYSFSGGLTTQAQLYLPEQRYVSASAAITHALSRVDGLATSASAGEAFTLAQCPGAPAGHTLVCLVTTPVAQALETLTHRISRSASMSVGVGVGASVIQNGVEEDLEIVPTASGSLSDRLGATGTTLVTLSSQLAPLVDVRTGLPSNRVQTNATLTSTLSESVVLSGTAGWLQSVPVPAADPNPITTLTGGIVARFRIDRQTSIGLGFQELWQHQDLFPPLASTLTSSIGYVSITARTPTQHL